MQDVLKQLIAPCGLVWLGLMLTTWLSWRACKRVLFACNLALLLAYTVLGNPWLGATALSRLDSRYSSIDSFAGEPYDAVCVLGGGTFTSRHGHAQLNSQGDRVMLGARLYLTGRTKVLVCTGRFGSSSFPDPADEYAEIWRDLNIPAEAIIQVGGRNTVEEIAEIERIAQQHGWKRVGLVTSSWHLRRAMAHANSRGLRLEPLPAAASSKSPTWSFRDHTVPQAKGFLANQFAFKELLGAILR